MLVDRGGGSSRRDDTEIGRSIGTVEESTVDIYGPGGRVEGLRKIVGKEDRDDVWTNTLATMHC